MNFDVEIIIRFLLAILWGGLVGAEREYRGKAAGFRTNIMISFGACFFTIMSAAIGGPNNPDRIAANIVTGIGFLGAGVIFQGNNRVSGITTAATIWCVAAVGMGLGAGYYVAAGCASFLILFILAILPSLQEWIDKLNQSKIITIKTKSHSNAKTLVETQLNNYNLRYKMIKQIRDADSLFLTWQIRGNAGKLDSFIEGVINEPFIERFEY